MVGVVFPNTGGSSSNPSGAGGSGNSGAGAGSPVSAGGADNDHAIHGGTCCPDGNCLCHGPDPSQLTSSNGPFETDSFEISTGTVYYPTNADPPFAAISLCGGFTNSGPEMAGWGPFYASYGIVTVITWTGALDLPNMRGDELVAAIEELKQEDSKSGGKLAGKLAGRYGTSGYSMGGGGTTFASSSAPSMMTSVGLAAWGPDDGSQLKVPTLFLCSDTDTVAGCGFSQTAYDQMPETTPKMVVDFVGNSHFDWFGPQDAGGGLSGAYALAFQKVYLEGDERWKKVLLTQPTGGSMTTNIQ